MNVPKKDAIKSMKEMWKKAKKEFGNNKFKEDIDLNILKRYLIEKDIDILTFNELSRTISEKHGLDVKNFLFNLLLNNPDSIQLFFKAGVGEKNYLTYLNKKYYKSFETAKNLYTYPIRWKLLTTELVQSKDRGVFFSSRIVRYDNRMLSFESLPNDYLILISHFINKLGEIKTEPENKLMEELDKLKLLIDDIKKRYQKIKNE